MNLKPLGERLVIEPLSPPAMSAGGILLPEMVEDRTRRGKVLAVGDEVCGVNTGDLVLYEDFAAVPAQDDGKLYMVLKSSEVLAVVREPVDGR